MTRAGRTALLIAVMPVAACGWRGEPDAGVPPAAEGLSPPPPPDSLLLGAPGGVTVWLTEGRPGSDSAGGTCVERSLEIRRDTARIKVPLLYTVSTPRLLNDTTLRAELAHNCRPADAYRVDLRTGRPTRIPDRP